MSPTSGRPSGWLPATDMPRYVRWDAEQKKVAANSEVAEAAAR